MSQASADETMVMMRRGAGGKRMPMAVPARPDGWTEAKRAAFLDHLAETCNIAASLRVVGMSPSGLYRLRQRSAQFRIAWDEALAYGYARLEAELLDRALNGKRMTAERDGTTATRIEYSDTLGLNLLAQHRRAVAEYRAATAALAPREDVDVMRTRIVAQIMAVVRSLPDR